MAAAILGILARERRSVSVAAGVAAAFFTLGFACVAVHTKTKLTLDIDVHASDKAVLCFDIGLGFEQNFCSPRAMTAGSQTLRARIPGRANAVQLRMAGQEPGVRLRKVRFARTGSRVELVGEELLRAVRVSPGSRSELADDLTVLILPAAAKVPVIELDVPRSLAPPDQTGRLLALALVLFSVVAAGLMFRNQLRAGLSRANSLLFGTLPRSVVVIGGVFGVAYALAAPPFEVSDEFVHFWRLFHVSEGHLVPQPPPKEGFGTGRWHRRRGAGGWLPRAVADAPDGTSQYERHHVPHSWQEIKGRLRTSIDADNRIFASFHGASVYSPVQYAVPGVAVAVARLANPSPAVLLYLGRIVNVLVAIVLVALALSILPIQGEAVLLLALLPTTVHRAASLSGDGTIFGLALLVVALMVRRALAADGEPSRRELAAMAVSAVALGLCKPGYVLFPALFLMIAPSQFASRTRYWLGFGLVVGAGLGAAALWNMGVVSSDASTFSELRFRDGLVLGAKHQIAYVLADPVHYVSVLFETFAQRSDRFAQELVAEFGWGHWRVSAFIAALCLALMTGLALASTNDGQRLRLRHRLTIALVLVASVVLVMSALYATYTPVGHSTVVGVSGRYFTPIAPLAILLLTNSRLRIRMPQSTINALLALVAVGWLTLGLLRMLGCLYAP